MTTQQFIGLKVKILNQFKLSIKNEIIKFIETEEEELEENEINFEIRIAESLGRKPIKENKLLLETEEEEIKSDPFSPPYISELYITEELIKEDEEDELGQEFVILLNKYCVVPRHFLLVTKEYENQTSPLTPVQLLATWKILSTLGSREKHLAFFNSGAMSGASQPHKHIQFIPLANGVAPFDSFISTHADPNSPFQLPLPYASFTCLLNPPTDPNRQAPYIANIFMALLDLVIDHLRRLALQQQQQQQSQQSNKTLETSSHLPLLPLVQKFSQLSYNVIMTSNYLHIVPRTKEFFKLINTGEELSINSLGFAGMLLVKSKETMEEVKKIGVLEILKSVAYPPVALGDSTEIEEQ